MITREKAKKIRGKPKLEFKPTAYDSYTSELQHQRNRETRLLPIDVMSYEVLKEILNELKKLNSK